jgi:glycerol uptake facilitator-like aquaporin
MTLRKQALAEFFGTTILLLIIVGSGIMGETLSQGNKAIALLANSIATGCGLYVLIQVFGPISGAHMNPVVTFAEYLFRNKQRNELLAYIFAQILGAILGVWMAHFLFSQEILQLSNHDRGHFHLLFSEMIATAGLLIVIFSVAQSNSKAIPTVVATYITAAYWFTSSTAFANPAVTIARSLTASFSGILWTGVPGFIFSQLCGTVFALFFIRFYFKKS